MPEDPPYILDIRGLDDDEPISMIDSAADPESASPAGARSWIGINFECCGVYTRIYRNLEGTAYVGSCPHCCRQVRIRVGPGGTHHRMFKAI